MALSANAVADPDAGAPLRRGGRPRSSEAELAILQATRELLVEGGVQKLTVEGVAARVSVECESPLTRGQTIAAVSERHRGGLPATCEVITGLAHDRLFTLLAERIARLD